MFDSVLFLLIFGIGFVVFLDIFLCMGMPPSYKPTWLEYLFAIPFALFFSGLFVLVFPVSISFRTPPLFHFLRFAL